MITSSIYAAGSFGLRPRPRVAANGNLRFPDSQTMRVWFCGRQASSLAEVCAHLTRGAARECRLGAGSRVG